MKHILQLIIISLSVTVFHTYAADSSGIPTLEEVKKQVTNISTDELQALIKDNPKAILIDVRTTDEIAASNVLIDSKNTMVIPRGWLEMRINDAVPDKNTTVVVYCGTNQRSPYAATTLSKMGYSNVKNYADGLLTWQEKELPVKLANNAPTSMLINTPVKVIDGIYSAIGETAPPSYANAGHNNNLSFIISDDGVLVVNAGDSYLLAKSLHEEIKKLTDQPIKYVVLENGQGHAMLGSNYWKEQGVPIIAHTDTVKEIEKEGEEQLARMQIYNRDKSLGTKLVMPDKTFDDKLEITLGKEKIEILNLGPAHSPGDTMVWLPERSLIITGDMAFHERLLPVFEYTDTAAWLETWEKFAALNAKYVIPGHGGPTNMEEVTKYTKNYLADIRNKLAKVIEDGGDLQTAYAIDQSAYSHLATFDILARQNAGRVFRAMEFE